MGLGTAVGAPRNVAKVLSMFVSTAAASWTNHVPNGLSKMQPLERLMGKAKTTWESWILDNCARQSAKFSIL